eukprot:Nitzschia sp. Nitz4//scaffold91_size79674//45896//48403//NITZ4_005372-RA/size79674-processed-gene-0.96-mRNA-1//1//CDS//3329560115//7036//frame0
MTTVSLRGTLVLASEGGKEAEEGSDASKSWQWKGLWAFGGSVAAAAAHNQQPFHYKFQRPEHPSQVPIPGLILQPLPEAEQPPTPTAADSTTTTEPVTNNNPQEGDPSHSSNADQPTSTPQQGQTTTPATDNVKDSSGDNKPAESTETSKPSENATPATATTNNNDATEQQGDEKGDADQPNQTSDQGQDSQGPEAMDTDPAVITFATVAEGDPEFTDAAVKYPDIPCPVSGEWKGYFQNAPARPKQSATKVTESFHLFLNATPAESANYFFDERPLPPTVHKDSLVHVRGTGTNPFGTFELLGYLDLSSMVLEMQRQYVYIPPSPRKRNASPHRRGTATSSSVTTRNKKSYFTRKRQPSWKRKSLEEQQEETQQLKKQRVSIGGKKPKPILVTGSSPSSSGVPSDTTVLVGTAGPAEPTLSISINPNLTIIPPPPMVVGDPMTTPKKGGSSTPRKRSSSVGKASTGSGGGGSGTKSSSSHSGSSSSQSSSSLYIKLPPVGEPKKARWRAAHFLYYQRQDPEQPAATPETPSTPKGDSKGSASAAVSANASATPNPKYVVYEGEMVNGHREGRGICLFSNGMLYEGEWRRNKEHGRGRLWTADRRRLIYDGEWERGRMQGLGTYYYYTGSLTDTKGAPPVDPSGTSRYIGEFKENMRNGTGQYILPDGSVYDGQWSQGKMNGRGVFTWPDCSVYEGEFKDNQRHGQGLLKTSDGFVYDGMWVHNAMEGRGMAHYPNGQTYEGMFANGRREGRGTIRFTNGAVYEGRFRDDAVDGQGTMKMSRSVVVPNNEMKDTDSLDEMETNTAGDKPDFMIPISFQSDMSHIHAKAGFTAGGE